MQGDDPTGGLTCGGLPTGGGLAPMYNFVTPQAEDRIAFALERLATIAEKWFEKLYPVKADVRDATITHHASDEEKEVKARIQGEEPTLDDWRTLGPREQEFLRRSEESSKRTTEGQQP